MLLNGNQRSQAQFERAKWRAVVLFPTWIIQLALTMTMMGLFAWRLGDTMKTFDEEKKHGGVPVIEVVWEATNVGLSFVASFCTFFEIAKYFAESLTPWTMLFTHIIKLTCALAILALDVVVYVQISHEKHYSLVGLGLDCGFILTTCVLVFYAVRGYRRLSAYEDYAHPVNVKAFGFRDEDIERDTSYPSRLNGPRASLDGKRFSSASSRLSMSSAKNEPVEMDKLDRTPSIYSHQRDTQFDDYVARRGSTQKSERALSGDFGQNGSPDQQNENGRRDSLTSATGPTRPRGLSAPRALSWASDRGLVAVPEEDDDDTTTKDSKNKKDREALLGDGPRESIDGSAIPQEADLVEPRWQRE